MKARTWLLWGASFALGCAEARREPPSEPVAKASIFLGDAFELSGRSCRVANVRTVLTELDADDAGAHKPRPDVLALSAQLRCEGADGQPAGAASQAGVPPHVQVRAEGPDGTLRLPSSRTRLAQLEPGPAALVFELPADQRWLRPTLAWNAGTGAPEPALPHTPAQLIFVDAGREIRVALEPALLTQPSFRRFSDALARALVRGEPSDELCRDSDGKAALSEAVELFQTAQRDWSPRTLRLVRTERVGALEAQLTLRLEAPQRPWPDRRHLELELTVAEGPDHRYAVTGAESDLPALRESLLCQGLMEQLDEGVLKAAHGTAATESCNAAGLLVPGTCRSEQASLVARALRVRARCHPALAARFGARERLSVPQDFQLTLRRAARRGSELPRYTLTLFASGQVAFRVGGARDGQGRSNGRTARPVLEALHHTLHELDWLGRRRATKLSGRSCARTARGDLITVRAHGRERAVMNRPGCRAPFTRAELRALRDSVELAAGVTGWTRPRPRDLAPGAQVWIVSDD